MKKFNSFMAHQKCIIGNDEIAEVGDLVEIDRNNSAASYRGLGILLGHSNKQLDDRYNLVDVFIINEGKIQKNYHPSRLEKYIVG